MAKKKKIDKKKKVLIIVICTIIFACLFTFIISLDPQVSLIGKYEAVNGSRSDDLTLNLFTWSIGHIEDKECDLWGCDGHIFGEFHLVKGNQIKLKSGHMTMYYTYRIEKKGKDTYLILEDDSIDSREITFKKVNAWRKQN